MAPACAWTAPATFLPDSTHPPFVLITRPEPGASATARRLRAMGLAPLVSAALIIEPCPTRLPAPDGVQAILLTSATAAPLLPASFHSRPLLAVGDATAAKARDVGFTDVQSAAGDAKALLALATAACDPQGGSLLLPGAADVATDIVMPLRRLGFRVVRRIVYRSRPASALSPEVHAALRAETVKQVLFYSPASARAFVRLARGASLGGVEALAISAATADALATARWRCIRVASRPNQDALLELLS